MNIILERIYPIRLIIKDYALVHIFRMKACTNIMLTC